MDLKQEAFDEAQIIITHRLIRRYRGKTNDYNEIRPNINAGYYTGYGEQTVFVM